MSILDLKIRITGENDSALSSLRELSSELDKLSDASVNVDLDIGSALSDIAELESQLGSLSDANVNVDLNLGNVSDLSSLTSGLRDLESGSPYRIEVDLETNGALDELRRLGDLGGLGGAGGGGLAFAGLGGLAAAGAAIAVIGDAAIDAEEGVAQLAAQLGITRDEAQQFAEVGQNIYQSGWGGSLEEVNTSLSAVARGLASIGETSGEAIQEVTQNALTLGGAYGDTEQQIQAAITLQKNFGISSQEAFDMLAGGFQRGLNSSGDFLDSILEYSNQFSQSGASAAEFFSVLDTGLAGGVLGTDKAADMFKEFQNRILDGSKTTSDALAQIGLSSDEIAQKINSGQITVSEAFGLVQDKLRAVDDQAGLMQAGVGLLGTQFEDLGPNIALSIDTAAVSLNDLTGSMNAANETNATLTTAATEAWRTLVGTIANSDAAKFAMEFLTDRLLIFTEVLENLPQIGLHAVQALMTAFEDLKFTFSASFAFMHKLGVNVYAGLAKGWDVVQAAADVVLNAISNTFNSVMASMTSAFSEWAFSIAKNLPEIPGAIDMGNSLISLSMSLEQTAKGYEKATTGELSYTDALKNRNKETEQSIKAMHNSVVSVGALAQARDAEKARIRDTINSLVEEKAARSTIENIDIKAANAKFENARATESLGNVSAASSPKIQQNATAIQKTADTAKNATLDIEKMWEALVEREGNIGLSKAQENAKKLAKAMQETGAFTEEEIESAKELYEVTSRRLDKEEESLRISKQAAETSSKKIADMEKELRYAQMSTDEERKKAKLLDALVDEDKERGAELYEQLQTQREMNAEAEKMGRLYESAFKQAINGGQAFFSSLVQGNVSTKSVGQDIGGMGQSLLSGEKVFGLKDNQFSLGGIVAGGADFLGPEMAKSLGGFASSMDGFADSLGGYGNVMAGVGVAISAFSGDLEGTLSGIGSIAGSYFGPVGAMIGSELGKALAGLEGGETRAGGAYRYEGGNAALFQGPSGGEIGGDQVVAAIESSVETTNKLLETLGSSQRISDFTAALETSENGRGGVWSGGRLSGGAEFGEQFRGQNVFEDATDRNLDPQQALEAFQLDLQQSVVQALQAAVDTPDWTQAILQDIDVEALDAEGVQRVLNTVAAMENVINSMQKFGVSSEQVSDAMLQSAGGAQALAQSTGIYYQQFYSQQERGMAQLESAQSQITSAFERLGVEVPRTKDGFRSLVEGLDTTTEHGQSLFGSLMALSGPFAGYIDLQEKMQGTLSTSAPAMNDFIDSLQNLPNAIKKGDIAKSLTSAITEAKNRDEAGKMFAQNVAQQMQQALVGTIVNAVASSVLQSIVQPTITAATQSATIQLQGAVGGAQATAQGGIAGAQAIASGGAAGGQAVAHGGIAAGQAAAQGGVASGTATAGGGEVAGQALGAGGQAAGERVDAAVSASVSGTRAALGAAQDARSAAAEARTSAGADGQQSSIVDDAQIEQTLSMLENMTAVMQDSRIKEAFQEMMPSLESLGSATFDVSQSISASVPSFNSVTRSIQQMDETARGAGGSGSGLTVAQETIDKTQEKFDALENKFSEFKIDLGRDFLGVTTLQEKLENLAGQFSMSSQDVAKFIDGLSVNELIGYAEDFGVSGEELISAAGSVVEQLSSMEHEFSSFQASIGSDYLGIPSLGEQLLDLAETTNVTAEDAATFVRSLSAADLSNYADKLGVSEDALISAADYTISSLDEMAEGARKAANEFRNAFADFQTNIRQEYLGENSIAENIAEYAKSQGFDATQAAQWVSNLSGSQVQALAEQYGMEAAELMSHANAALRVLSDRDREARDSYAARSGPTNTIHGGDQLKDAADALKSAAESMRDAIDDLRLDDTLSPLLMGEKANIARKEYEEALAKFNRNMTEENMRGLEETGKQFLQIQREYVSGEAYQNSFERVLDSFERAEQRASSGNAGVSATTPTPTTQRDFSWLSNVDEQGRLILPEPETQLADGGIVTRPTQALIGESGPEAVIPLGNGWLVNEMKAIQQELAEMRLDMKKYDRNNTQGHSQTAQTVKTVGNDQARKQTVQRAVGAK